MTDVLKLENENYLIRKLEELNMGKKMCSGEGQLVSELAVWEWERQKERMRSKEGWKWMSVLEAEGERKEEIWEKRGETNTNKYSWPGSCQKTEWQGIWRWRWLSMKLRDTQLLFKREEHSNRDLGKWVMKSMQDSKLWHRVSQRRNATWMQKGDVQLFGKGIRWISTDLV